MATPKFNFVPERQLGELPTGDGLWKITCLKTNSALYFPTDMVHALEMDGKFYQFFADTEKKAIGWREVKEETTLEVMKDCRKLSVNKTSGAIIVSVGRILKKLNYTLENTLKDLVVQNYTSPLVKGTISYIVLPQIEKPKE